MAKRVKIWTATEEAISLCKAYLIDVEMLVDDAIDAACHQYASANRLKVRKAILNWIWADAMKKDREFNEMFELTIEKTDDEIDSLWIADDDNPCFARSAGWMFDENDSTLEALLIDQEVNALGRVEENERA